jgi:hypothetical protein
MTFLSKDLGNKEQGFFLYFSVFVPYSKDLCSENRLAPQILTLPTSPNVQIPYL